MYRKCIFTFKRKNEENKNKSELIDIEYLLHTMHASGLILQERITEICDDKYISTIVTIDENEFINFINKIEDNVGDEVSNVLKDNFEISYEFGNSIYEKDDFCLCENSDYFILNPEYDFFRKTSYGSLLKCGTCLKQIPFNEQWNLTKEDKEKLVKLQQTYNALEYLRLYEYETEFFEKEIENHCSKYNKLLFECRTLLESKTNKSVFIFLKNPVDGVYKEGRQDLEYCPVCNRKLIEVTNCFTEEQKTIDKSKICKHCKIIVPSYNEYL